MIVTVDDHEELTDVVVWGYLKNKWHIGQTRIIIHNVGDISYTQLISGNVHLRFPVIIDVDDKRIITYYAPGTPIRADLSYDDWDDLFN